MPQCLLWPAIQAVQRALKTGKRKRQSKFKSVWQPSMTDLSSLPVVLCDAHAKSTWRKNQSMKICNRRSLTSVFNPCFFGSFPEAVLAPCETGSSYYCNQMLMVAFGILCWKFIFTKKKNTWDSQICQNALSTSQYKGVKTTLARGSLGLSSPGRQAGFWRDINS